MHAFIETGFHHIVDTFYALWPQPTPLASSLRSCKIVSHRGQCDNLTVFENTLEAFDTAMQNGVWGIEFDIRWTRDLKPVVFHDRDLERIFGDSSVIGSLEWKDLRRAFPLIPTLEEVLERYGGRMHLMVEIKQEPYPDPAYQRKVLSDHFSSLEPVRDYHFLSLVPEMFAYVDFVSDSAFLPVSQLNFRDFSRLALNRNYAGFAGHYLFVGKWAVRRHKTAGQQVGTGYPRSRNCLFRELNRGVEWIFSNHAVEMQRVVDACLGRE